MAVTCVLLKVETVSVLPLNAMVGFVLFGSKPLPVSMIWLVE